MYVYIYIYILYIYMYIYIYIYVFVYVFIYLYHYACFTCQTCHWGWGLADAVGCNCWLLIASCWNCATHGLAIPGTPREGGVKFCVITGVSMSGVIFCP